MTVTDSATPPAVISAPLKMVVEAIAGRLDSFGGLGFLLTDDRGIGFAGCISITVQSSVVTEPLKYSAAVSPGTNWLDITSGTTTPDSIGIALDPAALSLAA